MSSKKTFSVRPFDKLKKTLEHHAAAVAPPSPPRKQKKKEEEYTDEELFCREMDDVQEIEEFRTLACAPRVRKTLAEPRRLTEDQETLAILGEIAGGQRPMHLPDTQEYVEWTNPDYRDDIIPRLHEGRFSVQAYVDLHGCLVPEAEVELDEFLSDSFKKSLRCIKIIHGRGLRSVKGGRLKQAVVKRLSGHYRKDIIALVTARQCDGGLGALYVLLRRK